MTLPRTSLQPAERKMLLLAGDATCLAAASGIAVWSWSVWDPVRTFDGTDYILWLGLIPLWLAVAAVSRSYDLRVASIPGPAIKALLLTTAILLGFYVVVYFGAPRAALPRSVVLLHATVALVGLGGWRWLYATVFAQTRFRRRVLIVGAGDSGHAIANTLQAHGVPTFEVVGLLQDDFVGPNAPSGFPVLGETRLLAETVRNKGVSEVIVATDDALGPELLAGLLRFKSKASK